MRRVWWLAVAALVLGVFILYGIAHAQGPTGMMGVGLLMQPNQTGAAPSPPVIDFLTTDAGVILTDDAGTQKITTQ